jgi:hypothetical protein
MKSILLILSTIITFSISAQSDPKSTASVENELQVIFSSVYKIKQEYYGNGLKPNWKKTTDSKGLKHVTDKSMKDDNGLLLQAWYKLLKVRLEKMGLPAPENFDYINMQDQMEGAKKMATVMTSNQYIMITCNELSKAQKAHKKGTLTLESFNHVAISMRIADGSPVVKRGKNLAAILDEIEKEL